MTRADFENTFPYQKAENRLAGAVKTDTLYVNVNPVNDASDEAPAFGQASDLTLKDVIGLDYDENEDKWNELTSKLTLNECANLVVIGAYGLTKSLMKKGQKKGFFTHKKGIFRA